MCPYLAEWLNLALRWAHVTAAIMWVGDSFLFSWLDAAIEAESGRGAGSRLWLTHSGGFYEVVRHRSLGTLPERLHWFRWESYSTWLTGIVLLAVVFGAGSPALLLAEGSPLGHGAAVALLYGTLALAPLAYAGLCAVPGLKGARLAAAGLALVTALGAGLLRVLAPRAAFLLVGASLGTIMTANVFLVIIPAQRRMVAAIRDGRPVDTAEGERAKARSIHNHYLSLPVLFAMLSNHFPAIWGSPRAWAVLPLLLAAGAGAKLAMNLRGRTPAWAGAGTLACFAAVAALTWPPGPGPAVRALAAHAPVGDAEARLIVQRRCVTCHSTHPTNGAFTAPPNGVTFENADQMRAFADRIVYRVVETRTMPLGNLTGITDEERATLGAWAWRQAHP